MSGGQVRDGSERVDTLYIWPRTLKIPPRPPKLVYLDLNQWIALAKASTGHRDGRAYKDVLAACVDAVALGRAVFPISDSIYGEVSKLRQHRQRRDLRDAIEKVSRYMVVTSRLVVTAHEVEALLDHLVGPNPHPINSMDYLDWGVARAFGMVGVQRPIPRGCRRDLGESQKSPSGSGRVRLDPRSSRARAQPTDPRWSDSGRG
jgi:hypothetical protein